MRRLVMLYLQRAETYTHSVHELEIAIKELMSVSRLSVLVLLFILSFQNHQRRAINHGR